MNQLRLFVTTEYPCSYLAGAVARNLVADPTVTDQAIYSQLIAQGFRRSGDHIYRPHCEACQACQSLRLAATELTLNRSQQRCISRNKDLQRHWLAATFSWEHYRLFERYVRVRHRDGGMDETSPEHYFHFITSDWSDTRLCEFRDSGERLLAVSVVDQLSDGLSAVYTFFDPDQTKRALGTLAILEICNKAKELNLPWIYLGYWIENCAKMAYKINFRPFQLFQNGLWSALKSGIETPS